MLAAQRHGNHVLLDDLSQPDPSIESALDDIEFFARDGHVGITLRKARQQRAQQEGLGNRRGREPKVAARRVARVRCIERAADVDERPLQRLHQLRTRVGQLNRPRGAHHQRDAERVLEPPDILADCGTGDAHPVGRRAELPFLGDGEEQRRKIQVHIIVQ